MSNNSDLNENEQPNGHSAEGQQDRVPVHESPTSESTPPSVPPEDSAATQRLSNSDAIVSLAIEAEAELFLNQYKEEYAWVPVEEPQPHHECVNISSKDFQFWLLKLCERHSKETPKPGALRDACNILRGCLKRCLGGFCVGGYVSPYETEFIPHRFDRRPMEEDFPLGTRAQAWRTSA